MPFLSQLHFPVATLRDPETGEVVNCPEVNRANAEFTKAIRQLMAEGLTGQEALDEVLRQTGLKMGANDDRQQD